MIRGQFDLYQRNQVAVFLVPFWLVIGVVVLNFLFILLVQVRVVVARAALAVALETKKSFSYFVFKVVKRKM